MTKLEKEAMLKPEQLAKLKELFPQAVVDGKVDFVLLKALLGEQVEGSTEKYQFTWNGKQNAIAHAQKPSLGTLREDKASSKDFDSTENLYIEGDNLEVLKLLQKTYQGKIKMIYIDPPYNTGNDFVYKDDFKDNVRNYLELTNQKNKSNAETSGRYHTDWLNMMYPRLMLARNLLTDDGVIFISIDDNEQSNLKKICDEIFGEINCISTVKIYSNPRGRQSNKLIVKTGEYILVYSKNIQKVSIVGEDLNEETISTYNKKDDFGVYREIGLRKRGTDSRKEDSPTLFYPIYFDTKNSLISLEKNEAYIEIIPKLEDGSLGRWRWSKEKVQNEFNLLVCRLVSRGSSKEYDVFQKDYLSDEKELKYKDFWFEKEINYDRSSSEIRDLFDQKLFDYSKPIYLIDKIVKMIKFLPQSNYILDFFSGSATTAHAVLKLNAEDGGNRKFIMVQLPEKTEEDSEAYKAGYQNICEIGKERIRRAGEKVKQEMLVKDASADVSKLDVGFKVYKLDSTNIKPWDGTQDINQMLIEASGNVVKKDRTDLDVVHELMLMYGVFNEEVEEIKINGKTLYSIGEHFLVVCLFKSITKQDIEAIIKLKPKNVIFNDAGFENDNVKINAELTLKNHGVEDIKSL